MNLENEVLWQRWVNYFGMGIFLFSMKNGFMAQHEELQGCFESSKFLNQNWFIPDKNGFKYSEIMENAPVEELLLWTHFTFQVWGFDSSHNTKLNNKNELVLRGHKYSFYSSPWSPSPGKRKGRNS